MDSNALITSELIKQVMLLEQEVLVGDAHVRALEAQSEIDHETLAMMTEQVNRDGQRIIDLETQRDIEQALIEELESQGELDRDQIENLRIALTMSLRIGAAVGVLMSTYEATSLQAFGVLKSISRDRGRRLRDVAEDVLELAEAQEDRAS